jgi:IS30 family transposase
VITVEDWVEIRPGGVAVYLKPGIVNNVQVSTKDAFRQVSWPHVSSGLLRDYFPKGTDLSTISPEELQRVADELNDRPRKTLDWARPADLITDVAIRTA